MPVAKWFQRFNCYSDNKYSYFGEVESSGNTIIGPKGTGLIYSNQDDTFIINESIQDYEFNGIFIARINPHESKLRTFQAGFMKNGVKNGPCLESDMDKKNGRYNIAYGWYKNNELTDKPIIYITPQNEFVITSRDSRLKGFRALRFKYGKILVEYRERELIPGKIIGIIDCGWDFEPIYQSLDFVDVQYFDKSFIRPVRATRNGKNEEFFGMVQGSNRYTGFEFIDAKKGKIFTNTPNGYCIDELPSGNKYFGPILNADDGYGGFYYHGLGCYKKGDNSYLGCFNCGHKIGYFLTQENGKYYFGRYMNDEKEGCFFEISEYGIILRSFKNGYCSGGYKISNYTLDVTRLGYNDKEYEEYNYRKLFEQNPNGIKFETKDYDRISPSKIELLIDLGLDYEINNKDEIIVTGRLDSSNFKYDKTLVRIPDCVTGVSANAFKGDKNIKKVFIDDDVKFIEEGAFDDCVNIESVRLGKGLTSLEKNLFASKKIKEIAMPSNIKVIKSFALYYCEKLTYVKFASKENCVIEENALPPHLTKKKKDKPTKIKKEKKEEKRSLIGVICSTLLSIISLVTLPFVLLWKLIKSIKKSPILLLSILLGVSILYVFMAKFEWISYLLWDIRSITSGDNMFFGYNWELASFGIEWLTNMDGNFFICVLIFVASIIVLLLGGLIDLIIYIILFILLIILPLVIQTVIQLLITFGIPVLIPIVCLILTIKKQGKVFSIIVMLTSIVCCVLYFIYLVPLLKIS